MLSVASGACGGGGGNATKLRSVCVCNALMFMQYLDSMLIMN